ncbi:hypothetical protein B0T17DRAFT_603393 [Bombardia bombarda]|uniref:Tetratricopeptide repeat protein n=1 Tax=Bombardia bombarda TaxID=252184 RepID=A0AA39U1Q3_9PEZI|nr:hypothetical protein B0T17DRAFT_603393 [Bombardia bombarda]
MDGSHKNDQIWDDVGYARRYTADKAVWDQKFSSLDQESRCLLGVLSFLSTGSIGTKVLMAKTERDFPEHMALFVPGNTVLASAIAKLVAEHLVDARDKPYAQITVPKVIRALFKELLTEAGRVDAFNNAVALVLQLFPTEDAMAAKLNILDRWLMCLPYFGFFSSLTGFFEDELTRSAHFKASWQFCELLNRMQRLFSDMNDLQQCEKACSTNLLALDQLEPGPRKEDLKATIISHQAQTAESSGDAQRAIQLNIESYKIRLAEQPKKTDLLCYTAANLGYTYSSAGNQESALESFKEAREWWGDDKSDYPLNILVNEARCYLLLGDYDRAAELLSRVTAPANIAKDANLAAIAFGHFAMGLLYERQKDFELAKGKYSKAQNVWSGGRLDNPHLFLGACMYRMGVISLNQHDPKSAIKHIKESMSITSSQERYKNMPANHARNLFKLSQALALGNDDPEVIKGAKARRDEAETLLRNNIHMLQIAIRMRHMISSSRSFGGKGVSEYTRDILLLLQWFLYVPYQPKYVVRLINHFGQTMR